VRKSDRLAHLQADQQRQFLAMCLNGIGEAVQNPLTLSRRHRRPPVVERVARRRHRRVDIAGVGVRHRRDHGPVPRCHDIGGGAGVAVNLLPADDLP
jgi:hypothetical protein